MSTDSPDPVEGLLETQQAEWDRRTARVESRYAVAKAVFAVIAALVLLPMAYLLYNQIQLFIHGERGSLEHQAAFALFIVQLGLLVLGFVTYVILAGLAALVRNLVRRRIGLRPGKTSYLIPSAHPQLTPPRLPPGGARISMLEDGSWKVLVSGREFRARVLPSRDMGLRSRTEIEFTEQGAGPVETRTVQASPKPRTTEKMIEQAVPFLLMSEGGV